MLLLVSCVFLAAAPAWADVWTTQQLAQAAAAGQHRLSIRQGREIHMRPGSSHIVVDVDGRFVQFVEYGSDTVMVERLRLRPGQTRRIRARGGYWLFTSQQQLASLVGTQLPVQTSTKQQSASTASSSVVEVHNWEELQAISRVTLQAKDSLGQPTKDGGRLGYLRWGLRWRVTDDWRVLSESTIEKKTGEIIEEGREFYAWYLGSATGKKPQTQAQPTMPVPIGGQVIVLGQTSQVTPASSAPVKQEINLLASLDIQATNERFQEVFMEYIKRSQKSK